MSAVWINAVWILFCATLDVASSNYSEDQCSWRGRQVIFKEKNITTPFSRMHACVRLNEIFQNSDGTGASLRACVYNFNVTILRRVSDAPLRHVVTRSSGAIKMFAVPCSDCACGLCAGDLGGPDRQTDRRAGDWVD